MPPWSLPSGDVDDRRPSPMDSSTSRPAKLPGVSDPAASPGASTAEVDGPPGDVLARGAPPGVEPLPAPLGELPSVPVVAPEPVPRVVVDPLPPAVVPPVVPLAVLEILTVPPGAVAENRCRSEAWKDTAWLPAASFAL